MRSEQVLSDPPLKESDIAIGQRQEVSPNNYFSGRLETSHLSPCLSKLCQPYPLCQDVIACG